ncbi:MAG: ABC transporter permease [Rhodocyclaceae bacterium]|nr:ABC transporter permease [Rhodocyclaceae bacterium]
MSLGATLAIAIEALRAHALRSLLTMLGIVIGVAAVIVMIAVGDGARRQLEAQIKSLGANLMMVFSASPTFTGARAAVGSTFTLSEEDAFAIGRELSDYVAAAAPALRGSGQIVAGNANWSTTFYGVTPEYFEVREWTLAAGRLFDEAEINGAAKVAILGQTVARELFGEGNPLEQTVRIRTVPLTVIGVLAAKGQSPSGTDLDDVLLMPITTARNRVLGSTTLAKSRAVGSIQIKLLEGVDHKEAEEKIRELLRQRHRLQPGQDDDFTLRNMTEILQAREDSSKTMSWLLAAVASVSLLVGGIGIMNIMFVSVTERTREIGIRRAVGARAKDIRRQFLVEASLLAAIGGLIGCLVGAGGSLLLGRLTGWPIELSLGSMLLSVGFAATIGIFFGFTPAQKAARLSPIEALRHE